MAEDARISTALPTHPKTVMLQRRLGDAGCWNLIRLFLWTADNRCDGNLSGMSTEYIEIAAGWNGEVGKFVNALKEVNYLDGEEGAYEVHDWVEHNPYAAGRSKRVEKAKHAIAKRWEYKRNTNNDGGNTSGMPYVEAENSPARPSRPSTPNTKPQRASRLPDDFLVTDEHRIFASQHGLPNPDSLIGAFRDHFKGKPGKDGTKLDWDATFRNWMRNAPKYEPKKASSTSEWQPAKKLDSRVYREGL